MYLLYKYSQLLIRRPIVTNMVTTGFLFGSGDCIAQSFFSGDQHQYNYWRTIRATTYGGIVFAPIGDRWYKLLSGVRFPGTRLSSGSRKSHVYDTLMRVGCDQLLFAPFVGIPMYYTVMPFLELREAPLEHARDQISEKWWPTLRANWAVWPSFQLANFYAVPPHFRLLAVNVLSILWNSYLSYSAHLLPVPHIAEVPFETDGEEQK